MRGKKYIPNEGDRAKGWNDVNYQEMHDLWTESQDAYFRGDYSLALQLRMIVSDFCEDVGDLHLAKHHRSMAEVYRRKVFRQGGVGV